MADAPFGYGDTELEKTFQKLRELYSGSGEADNPFERTLGKMIRAARKNKGMSRGHLAQLAQISPNSLSKYELAGEPDGQFPPLPKMALICMALDIDPREALYCSLPFEFAKDDDGKAVCHHMDFGDFLRTLDVDQSELLSAEKMLIKQIEKTDRLYDEILDLREQLKMKNDPDQKGPGHSENTTTKPEVVDATSSNQPKNKGG